MKKTKPTFELWEVILIALISSIIMSATTGYALYNNKKVNKCVSVTNNEYIDEFITSYNQIITEYYKDVDEEELVNAAINGMVTYLDDPHTTYLNKNSKDLLLESLKGEYEGIGILITKNNNDLIEVINVYENTPAASAGILKGDILKTINDIDVTKKTPEEAVLIIKEDINKNIKIEVSRNDEIIAFTVIKKILNVPVINTEVFEKNEKKVGYIHIEKFSETALEQFSSKLKELEKQEINSLIVDVRDNTGGYLKSSKDIASLFLKENKIIYSLQTNTNKTDYKDETKEKREYPVAVLINKNSASASEVLAGALKYSYGATLIGVNSYGKGTVQQTSNINSNAMIKYTTAKWLMPNGKNIDGVGLTPDIKVEINLKEEEKLTKDTDSQLQRAILELTK